MDKILKGSLILTSSNLIVRVIGHLYRILMGRLLIPYEFGILNLALPFQYLIIILTSSGIAPSIAKFVSEYDAKKNKERLNLAVSSSLVYYPLIGLIFGIVFFILAEPIGIYFFHDANVILPLKISTIALPFGILIAVYTGIFQGFKKFEYMSLTLIFEQLARILVALMLVYLGLKATGAILGSSLGFIFTLPVAYILFRHMNLRFSAYSLESFKEIFYFSLPTSIVALSAFVLAYIDIIFLGLYLSPSEVGIYSAASPTSRLILAFVTALYAVLLPSISELKAKKLNEKIKRRAKESLLFASVILIISIILSIRYSKFIITFLFGSNYVEATAPFEILVIGAAFLGIFMLSSGIFQGLGKPKVPMKILLIAALLDVLLNILLIPEFHIEGAALATTISSSFAGISSLVMLKRALK